MYYDIDPTLCMHIMADPETSYHHRLVHTDSPLSSHRPNFGLLWLGRQQLRQSRLHNSLENAARIRTHDISGKFGTFTSINPTLVYFSWVDNSFIRVNCTTV